MVLVHFIFPFHLVFKYDFCYLFIFFFLLNLLSVLTITYSELSFFKVLLITPLVWK